MKAQITEHKVTLAGREYVLRPTFEALCEVETLAGENLLRLLTRANLGINSMLQQGLGLKETAIIIASCLKTGPNEKPIPSHAEVGSIILTSPGGYIPFSIVASSILTEAFRPPEGEEKKTAPTTSPPSASSGTASTESPSPSST